jgi:hypothetical protein
MIVQKIHSVIDPFRDPSVSRSIIVTVPKVSAGGLREDLQSTDRIPPRSLVVVSPIVPPIPAKNGHLGGFSHSREGKSMNAVVR